MSVKIVVDSGSDKYYNMYSLGITEEDIYFIVTQAGFIVSGLVLILVSKLKNKFNTYKSTGG